MTRPGLPAGPQHRGAELPATRHGGDLVPVGVPLRPGEPRREERGEHQQGDDVPPAGWCQLRGGSTTHLPCPVDLAHASSSWTLDGHPVPPRATGGRDQARRTPSGGGHTGAPTATGTVPFAGRPRGYRPGTLSREVPHARRQARSTRRDRLAFHRSRHTEALRLVRWPWPRGHGRHDDLAQPPPGAPQRARRGDRGDRRRRPGGRGTGHAARRRRPDRHDGHGDPQGPRGQRAVGGQWWL